MSESFVIPGLPAEGPWGDLRTVPSWLDRDDIAWDDASVNEGGRKRWREWRERLADYRAFVHDAADTDIALRAEEIRRCSDDVKYFLAMYGWILEPRDHVDPDSPLPGWRHWALMPHQVLLLDAIVDAMKHPSPLGDLVVEKSRDMGATWTFCGWVAHSWLFKPVFTAGLMSYREAEVVEDHPDSMFYKVKSILGIDEGQPGVPVWMFPNDFWLRKKELDRKSTLAHPTKSNFVRGETMTALAGSGNRTTVRIQDEAAKWQAGLRNIMSNTFAVTQHNFTLSSAYVKFGDDFKRLVDFCRNARPGERTPRLIRLETKLHPLHDDDWVENEREKYRSTDRLEDFEREVMISYRGGAKYVYTDRVQEAPVVDDLAWDSSLVTIVSLDIGIADDTAIVVAQLKPRPDVIDPAWNRVCDVRWLDSYSHNGEGADFYAHVLTGILPDPDDSAYLSFFSPNGQDLRDAKLREFMDFMAILPWDKNKVKYTGDPAGRNREQATKTSFYKELFKHSLELRRRVAQRGAADRARHVQTPIPIVVQIGDLYPHNSFSQRQEAMRVVLRRSSFANTSGALAFREALFSARRLDPTPRQTKDPGMAHDDWSHLWSAGEFASVFIRIKSGWKKVDEAEVEKDLNWLARQPPGPTKEEDAA